MALRVLRVGESRGDRKPPATRGDWGMGKGRVRTRASADEPKASECSLGASNRDFSRSGLCKRPSSGLNTRRKCWPGADGRLLQSSLSWLDTRSHENDPKEPLALPALPLLRTLGITERELGHVGLEAVAGAVQGHGKAAAGTGRLAGLVGRAGRIHGCPIRDG